MSYQQQDEEPEVSFSGQIVDGKIIGLTATDNRGGEYKITIYLEQTNPISTIDRICWSCGSSRDEGVSLMLCHQVPCVQVEV